LDMGSGGESFFRADDKPRCEANGWSVARAETAAASRHDELSTRFFGLPDLRSLLREALEAVIDLQGADFGNIQLFNEQTGTLDIVAQWGFENEVLAHFRSAAADDRSVYGRAFKQRRHIVIEDVSSASEFEAHRDIAVAAGFSAMQSTPLVERDGGRPIGMLSTYFRNPKRPSEHELRLTDAYACQVADLIAARRAQDRLRESEAWLRAGADLLSLSLYSWVLSTNALRCDGRLRAMWGLAPITHVDMGVFWAGIHPQDRLRVEAAVAASLDPAGDGVFTLEFRVIGITDGVERWISTRSRTLFERGRAVAVNGVAFDVTERKRAEEQLRRSGKRFQQFADHSGCVLWILDLETSRLEYLSSACERVWGRPAAAVLEDPANLAETIHPDDRASALDALSRVRNGEAVRRKYRILRPDGSLRWIQETIFPIPDERSEVRRAGGIAQDVTNQGGSQVYVVDVDDTVRQRLTLLLQGVGYQVKAFASTTSFLEMAPVLAPGCIVLGIGAEETSGLATLRKLKPRQIGLPVIVLGNSNGEAGPAVQAMKAGAADWLEASCASEALLAAVASALADIRERADADRAATLARRRIMEMSDRERAVLGGLMAGDTNKTIARRLGISPRTVEIHRAHVMERLGVRTLPEAVLLVASTGLAPVHLQPAQVDAEPRQQSWPTSKRGHAPVDQRHSSLTRGKHGSRYRAVNLPS
jgi:PAS domain S-box-containing protein